MTIPTPSSSPLVRLAQHRDLPGILAILNAEIEHDINSFKTQPLSAEQGQAWFTAHPADRFPVLVAEADGCILGWASVSPWSTYDGYHPTVEASIWLAQGQRGAGLGTRLFSALLDRAREVGHRVVATRVEAGNAASCRLHTKLGFRHVGVMHGVGEKFGRSLDVNYYELPLHGVTRHTP